LRRVADSTEAELIYYERRDGPEPKESRYVVYRTSDPDTLGQALTAALGVRGRVRKRRTLYLVGPTRVHLDEVEGLGDFVELEVVLQPHETASDGIAVARRLMDKLGIAQDQLVTGAYTDLLQ
jgi:predicted adenylyl cyclase CyaB